MSNFHPMGSAFSAKMESNSKAVKIELCRAMRRAKEENERRLAAKAAKEAEDKLRKEREMAVIEIDAGLATVLSRSLGTPKALLSALSKAQALVAAGEQSSKAIEAPLKEVNLLSFTGGDAISLISALSSEVLGLQPGAEAANLVDAVGVERLDRPETVAKALERAEKRSTLTELQSRGASVEHFLYGAVAARIRSRETDAAEWDEKRSFTGSESTSESELKSNTEAAKRCGVVSRGGDCCCVSEIRWAIIDVLEFLGFEDPFELLRCYVCDINRTPLRARANHEAVALVTSRRVGYNYPPALADCAQKLQVGGTVSFRNVYESFEGVAGGELVPTVQVKWDLRVDNLGCKPFFGRRGSLTIRCNFSCDPGCGTGVNGCCGSVACAVYKQQGFTSPYNRLPSIQRVRLDGREQCEGLPDGSARLSGTSVLTPSHPKLFAWLHKCGKLPLLGRSCTVSLAMATGGTARACGIIRPLAEPGCPYNDRKYDCCGNEICPPCYC